MGLLKNKREKAEKTVHVCPVCDYEFKGEYEKCPECGAPLNSEGKVVASEDRRETVIDLDIAAEQFKEEEPEVVVNTDDMVSGDEDFPLEEEDLDELLASIEEDDEPAEENDEVDDLFGDLTEFESFGEEAETEDFDETEDFEEVEEEYEEEPEEEYEEEAEEEYEEEPEEEEYEEEPEEEDYEENEEEPRERILLDELARNGEEKRIPLSEVADVTQDEETVLRVKGSGYEVVTGGFINAKIIKATEEEAELLVIDKKLKKGEVSVFEKAKMYRREEELIDTVKTLFKADSVSELNGITDDEIERFSKVAESLSEKFEGIYFTLETAETLCKMTKGNQSLVGSIATDMGVEHITLDTARMLKVEKNLDESKIIRLLSEDNSRIPDKETLMDMIKIAVREVLAEM